MKKQYSFLQEMTLVVTEASADFFHTAVETLTQRFAQQNPGVKKEVINNFRQNIYNRLLDEMGGIQNIKLDPTTGNFEAGLSKKLHTLIHAKGDQLIQDATKEMGLVEKEIGQQAFNASKFLRGEVGKDAQKFINGQFKKLENGFRTGNLEEMLSALKELKSVEANFTPAHKKMLATYEQMTNEFIKKSTPEYLAKKLRVVSPTPLFNPVSDVGGTTGKLVKNFGGAAKNAQISAEVGGNGIRSAGQEISQLLGRSIKKGEALTHTHFGKTSTLNPLRKAGEFIRKQGGRVKGAVKKLFRR